MAGAEMLPKGIVKDKDTFRVRVTYLGKRYSLGNYDTLSSARKALDKARGEMAVQTFVPPAEERAQRRARSELDVRRRVTLREWSDRWLDDLALNGKSESTVVSRRSVLRAHVWDQLGDVPLGQLDEDRVRAYMADLKVTPAVRRNVGLCLRACLNAAVKAGRLERSPFRLAVVDSPESPGKTITVDQVNGLADSMPPGLALAVYLGAWCQLRLGEVLGLRRDDFSLDDTVPTVTVARQLNSKTSPPTLTPPKAGSARAVALPSAMVPTVRAHLAQRVAPEGSAPVFSGRSSMCGHLSQSAFDRIFRRARQDAGLGDVRFHDLRHTGLTLFAQAGGTVADIMRRGGHKDVRVAMRYQHAALEREHALLDRMGLGGGDSGE